jgi:hypothetical protein
MSDQTDYRWQQIYDDRYGLKLTRGDDSIKLSRPHTAVDEADKTYEVVGHIGDRVYHTTHARENEALDRVAILVLLDKREPTFEEGEQVYVVSDCFDPVVQRGMVAPESRQHGDAQSVEIVFPTDPFESDVDRSRTIACDPSELLHVDADTVEVLRFIGRDDLLEWEDFAESVEVTDSA